jgi:iron complex outermembrane receptor protein
LEATQPPRTLSRSEGNVSPTVSLNFKATPNLFAYFTFSQGYKSGGFNVFSIVTPATKPSDNAEYKPESVNNFEVGLKSEFFDHRLRFNASAYYMDYKNLQENQLVLTGITSQFQTSNAAKARSMGIELEVVGRPTRELQLGATYGYDDATFNSFAHATTTDANYTGNTLPRAPRHNASIYAELNHPLTDQVSLFGRVEASYRSRVYFGIDNALFQDPLTLVNARIGVQAPSGRWGVYLWGRNLGNVDYAIDKEFGAIVPGQTVESIAAPRTFGVELRARY